MNWKTTDDTKILNVFTTHYSSIPILLAGSGVSPLSAVESAVALAKVEARRAEEEA